MRTTLVSIGLALALIAVAGCKKDSKKAEPAAEDTKAATDTPPPAEPPPAEPPPPAEDPTKPTMENKMANCPSAAPGATTTVKADKTSVTVTVTSKDKAAVAEIQKRAKKIATLDTSADADIKHTGEGTGGGQLGQCPVVMTDVTLKVKDSKTGTAITMTPKDKAKLADLEKMAKERAESMPAMDAPAGGDAAGGAGGEPPKEEPAGKGDDAKKGDAPK